MRETHDTWTLTFVPVRGEQLEVAPGQFTMLYVFGVGEVPISVSAAPLVQTIRAVGPVTRALCASRPGTVIGVRGPFGTSWPVDEAKGSDLLIVAGGVGLPPVRPALYHAIEHRADYGRVILLYGARTPEDIVFRKEIEQWRARMDLEVDVTVDSATGGWHGKVGVVPTLIPRAALDPDSTDRLRRRPRDHDALHRPRTRRSGPGAGADLDLDGAHDEMRRRALRPLPVRPLADLPRRRRLPVPGDRALPGGEGAVKKPKLAVWKFSSCDGCQLSLLDCEDELLAVAGAVDIAYFLEATSATSPGPYDVSLVEGSITTAHDAERILQVRKQSKVLITIGACATAGGIQALKNFGDVNEFVSIVYASPEYISTLATSTAIADHVPVDFELRGCPIDKHQLLEVVTAYLHGRRPNVPGYSVCMECKRRGTTCVLVAHGTPCLGPVTQAGCGAICPAYARGCYGCFGPDREPEHRGALEAVARRRHERPVARPGLPHVQRERTRVQGGEHPWVGPRRFRTDYLARVEGEGAMLVKIRDGKAVDVKLRIYEPPRFFEAFLRAGSSPRRPTSPPASAGSARSRTRRRA